MAKKRATSRDVLTTVPDYDGLLGEVVSLLESARRSAARAVNALMTATYWEIGRRIVESEQGGQKRAEYASQLIDRLSDDLTHRFYRGFSPVNLRQMRRFFKLWPSHRIQQTLSVKSGDGSILPNQQTASDQFALPAWPTATSQFHVVERIARLFPLPWSHYVKLLAVKDPDARRFYEQEALRGGWSVRQLDRQINSQFFERTMLSTNQAAMLRSGAEPLPADFISPEDEIKDPFVLEFLSLKDEYSELDLEEALIHKLEEFLLELGGDFAFIGRQRRLHIGDEWYRIDLLFFHRRLRCLVVIDLKIGRFSHADAGQMHLYLNYAREHWTQDGENPPVGLILCAQKDEAVAHYVLENLPNKVMAREYRLTLPNEKVLAEQLEETQRQLAVRMNVAAGAPAPPKRKQTAPRERRPPRKRVEEK